MAGERRRPTVASNWPTNKAKTAMRIIHIGTGVIAPALMSWFARITVNGKNKMAKISTTIPIKPKYFFFLARKMEQRMANRTAMMMQPIMISAHFPLFRPAQTAPYSLIAAFKPKRTPWFFPLGIQSATPPKPMQKAERNTRIPPTIVVCNQIDFFNFINKSPLILLYSLL